MAMSKIVLSLGLISFPAKLDPAKEATVQMSNLCQGSNGKPPHAPRPLKAPRSCDECGVITDYSGIVKGIPQGRDSYAIITQEDVQQAREGAVTPKGQVALVAHPAADFLGATGPGEKIYYVNVDASAADHYQLLVKFVTEHPEIVLAALYTPRSATGLYRLAVRDGALVLEERTREQALKPAPSVGGTVNAALYPVLEAAVTATTVPYEATAYEDKYLDAVKALAAAATVQTAAADQTQTATPVPVIGDSELIAQLQAQLAATA